jgi:hypothetical protein
VKEVIADVFYRWLSIEGHRLVGLLEGLISEKTLVHCKGVTARHHRVKGAMRLKNSGQESVEDHDLIRHPQSL